MKTILPTILALAILPMAFIYAQDEKPKEEKKPKTIKLETKDLAIYKTIEGVVESTRSVEIETDFAEWSDLIVETVRDQGPIQTGDLMLTFETEEIDRALAQAEFDLATAKLDAENANLSMEEVKKTQELDTKIAETKWQQAQEDHSYYFQSEKPDRIKSIDFSLKSSGWGVENSQEEFDQLQKMYNEDQLTEESEAIVLKRAQRSLERSKFFSAQSVKNLSREKDVEIPRDDFEENNSLALAQLEHEKFGITSQIKRARTEISLKKAEFGLQEKQKKYNELLADREKMTLKAPSGGLLYFGNCKRGKWLGVGGSANRELTVGKKIPVNKVLMTIVDPTAVVIRGDLEEELVGLINTGQTAKVKMTAGKTVFDATADVPLAIPMDNGKYDITFTPNDAVNLYPGATCKISVLVHQAQGQLVAPKKSVFTDDGINHYVFVADGSKVLVQVGMKSDDDIEILRGLSEGQEIRAEKP